MQFNNVKFSGQGFFTVAVLPEGWPTFPGSSPAGGLKASIAAMMVANMADWQAAGHVNTAGKLAHGTTSYYKYLAVYTAMVAGAPVCPANPAGPHANSNGAIGNGSLPNKDGKQAIPTTGPGRLSQHAYWHFGQSLPAYHAILAAAAVAAAVQAPVAPAVK